MKKIITLVIMVFAFAFGANAQEKKSVQEAANQDIVKLSKIAKLNDEDIKLGLYQLFESKHEILSIEDLSDERKQELSRVLEAKIRASITAEENAKLDKRPELLKELLN